MERMGKKERDIAKHMERMGEKEGKTDRKKMLRKIILIPKSYLI